VGVNVVVIVVIVNSDDDCYDDDIRVFTWSARWRWRNSASIVVVNDDVFIVNVDIIVIVVSSGKVITFLTQRKEYKATVIKSQHFVCC